MVKSRFAKQAKSKSILPVLGIITRVLSAPVLFELVCQEDDDGVEVRGMAEIRKDKWTRIR